LKALEKLLLFGVFFEFALFFQNFPNKITKLQKFTTKKGGCLGGGMVIQLFNFKLFTTSFVFTFIKKRR
jgi:hypothetical protein